MNGLRTTTRAKSLFSEASRRDRRSIGAEALPKRQDFVLEPLESRLLLSAVVLAPDWVSEGPQPLEQAGAIVPQNNEVSGAVQSIAVNPNNNSQIIVGTANGGVWRTTNASTASAADIAGIHWTPLTDQLGSLSIGAVAYDPADTTGNTFYAGAGLFSNAFDAGGTAVGLYRTTDGGASWTLLGDNGSGVNILAGNRIKSIAVSQDGQTILVGTINGTGIGSLTQPGGDASRNYALLSGEMYRSTDGGATFAQVGATLPTGAVTSVLFNPTSAQQVFAAVAGQGVFRSDDGGANWAAFSTGLTGAAASADIELAFQNIGGATPSLTLFAGVGRTGTVTGASNGNPIVITSNNHGLQTGDPVLISGVGGNTAANGSFNITFINGNQFSLNGSNGTAAGAFSSNGTWQWAGFFSTTNLGDGGNWTALAAAPLGFNPGIASFGENIQIVADPSTANVIYIEGQADGIFRYNPAAPGWVPITPAQGGTTVHGDSRDLQFLGNNTLLTADDGGFYFIQNPTNAAANSWNSFIGNLDAFEIWSVAYDSTNNVIIAGFQDNGSGNQNLVGTIPQSTWTQVVGNDGQFQAVDTTSLGGDVFRYSLSNNFGIFQRNRYTNADVFVSTANVGLRSSFGAANLSGLNTADANFSAVAANFSLMPFALNSVDPRMMMLGFSGLYEDADTTAANGFAGDVITNITANATGLGGNVSTGVGLVSAIEYGGFRGGTGFSNVAVVGDNSGGLWFRGETGTGFTNVTASIGTVTRIQSIALDPQDWRRVYVVSNNNVYFTADITNLVTNPFQVIGGGPSDNLDNLTSELRAVEVVGSTPVVGGLGGLFRYVGGVWSEYGQGLPNTVVHDVQWNAADDVLVVGTFGRGAWSIANASQTINDVVPLVITGDPFADDTIRLVIDGTNSSLLDVFRNGVLEEQAQLSVIQQINVNSLGGNDTLIVDSSNGLITVQNGIRYNGGDGFDSLRLEQTGGPTQDSDTYSVGPALGSGTSTIKGTVGAQTVTQTVFFEDLEPVVDLVPSASLTVIGTATDNAISYSETLSGTGWVAIDEHESIEFANKIKLTIAAGAGQDTISVNNPGTPALLTEITIDGGDPNSGDTLNITGLGALAPLVTVDTTNKKITGATGVGGAVSIDYDGIENLNLLAGIGDLTINTTGADDTAAVTPGLTNGANSGTVQSNGAVPQIAFANSGTFTANLGDGNDALVVNGSSVGDTVAVSETAVAIAGRRSVIYSGVEALTVNGNAGSDTFNVTPSLAVAMFIDGGDPAGVLPGDQLTILPGGAAVTFNAGPTADQGSFVVGANQPVSFAHIESIGITGNNSGSAVINGTNGPDAITVIADSTDGAADGVHDFTAAVNGGPAILFIDFPSLNINAGSGNDVVTLVAPAPNNANWNVQVAVNGGTPATDTDRLIVQTPGLPAALPVPSPNVIYTPNASDGGTLDLTSIQSLVTINGIDVLSYDGQGSNESLKILGTVGDDTIVHTPGANNDAGSFQVNALLALSYQNLGSGGSLTVDGAGGTDTLVYNGTAANDTFTIGGAVPPGGTGIGTVGLNSRLVLNTTGVQVLTLEGFAGDDTFTLVPAISDSVYSTINLNGGGQASATGDRVNLVETAGDDNITISGQVVSLGGKTINGTGIEDIRLDASGGNDRITYNGISGVSENIRVSSSGVAGGGQLSVPGVTLVDFRGTELINVNGNTPTPTETDTVTFAGTNAADIFQIHLEAAGTGISDAILRLQTTSGNTLLNFNYNSANFDTLNVQGLDGNDTFNVYTAATTTSRKLHIDGGQPTGKKKQTDTLNVFYTPPRPSIIQSTATQNPTSGIVDLNYGTSRFVVQYDDIEQVPAPKKQ